MPPVSTRQLYDDLGSRCSGAREHVLLHLPCAARVLADGLRSKHLKISGKTVLVCSSVALAREVLHNPNWALDAALKLGTESPYALMPPAYEFWLAKRAETVPELMPSTKRGID